MKIGFKGLFSSVFKACAPHMVALDNCSGIKLVDLGL